MKKSITKILVVLMGLMFGIVQANAQDLVEWTPSSTEDFTKTGIITTVGTGDASYEVHAIATSSSKLIFESGKGIKLGDNAAMKAGIAVFIPSSSTAVIENIEIFAYTGGSRKIYYGAVASLPPSSNGTMTASALPTTAAAVETGWTTFEKGTFYYVGGKSGGSGDNWITKVVVTFAPTGPSATLAATSGAKDQEIMATVDQIGDIVFNLTGGATSAASTIAWDGAGAPDWLTVTNENEVIAISSNAVAPVADEGNTYTYTITPSDGTTDGDAVTGKITVAPYVTPIVEITPKAGKDIAKKAGESISIIYDIKYANAASVAFSGVGDADATGLSGSYDKDNGVLTISGDLATQATYPATINYTISTANLDNEPGTSESGVITVKDPSLMSVAFLYDKTLPEGANKIYSVINDNYDVTGYSLDGKTAADMQAIIAESYDLIVLHESVPSGNAAALELGKSIGSVPILNTKSHMYGKSNWPTGGGQNGADGDVSINIVAGQENHQLFVGLTPVDGKLTIANTGGLIRYATGYPATSTAIALNQSGTAGNASILEDASGKYMMIALSAGSENMNADGLTLIKNACDYLMGIAPPVGTEAKITSFNIEGNEGVTINSETAPYTIEVMMPIGTTATSFDVSLTMPRGATLTAPASLTAVDFTAPVTFTVVAEDGVATANYTVTVSVASNPAPTIAFVTDETGNRTVQQGVAITAISFVAEDFSDVKVTGLPAGLSLNATNDAIEGTVEADAEIKAYEYTISAAAKDEGVDAATITGTITVTKAIVPYAGDFPYTTDIPADFTIPAWMDGNVTFEGNYDKSDATALGSGTDVLRFEQNEKVDFYLADATKLGVITVNLSATGGRTFNMYIDDSATPVATVSAKSNTKYELSYDATALTDGNLKITIENAGGGGATIGAIIFEVNKTALNTAIAAAAALTEAHYTADSWAGVASALTAATTVKNNAAATATEVEEAATALNNAVAALVDNPSSEELVTSNISVVALESAIRIKGAAGKQVAIYTLTSPVFFGTLSSDSQEIAVPSNAVYILNIEGESFKVIVP